MPAQQKWKDLTDFHYLELVEELQLTCRIFHGADDGVEFFGGTKYFNLISLETKMINLTGLKDGLEQTLTGMEN
jgi:hypothetical protein